MDSLHPDPANPRRISDRDLDLLTGSLHQWEMVQPIIARREDRVVIAGHQRLVAARRAGIEDVPVVFLDLDVTQARLLGIALNKIQGEWDEQLLGRLLAELGEEPTVDLSLSGFDEGEVRTLLRDLEADEKRHREETFDVETALSARDRVEAVAKPGDLWLLGEHRLLCGDATDPEAYARLLEGKKAAMAFTDPPYNVDYGNHGGQGKGRRPRPIANDALSPEAWGEFVSGWASGLVSAVCGALYICMSSREWPSVCAALDQAGAEWSDTIIWAKDRFVLGWADYQRQYEPIWYGWPRGAGHTWCGDRDQGDVWKLDRPSASTLHPTMKPVGLVERAVRNSSKPGDLVLDVFLGSGTTLMACERTGRLCAGMELEPHYVDTAVARWEAFTGERAVRA